VNVNVNVNKQEDGPGSNLATAPAGGIAIASNGAALEKSIREAVNNALDEN